MAGAMIMFLAKYFPFPGDIYIFPGCQVIKFAANPESPPALGLIQTNHSMPVSRHHDDDGDDDQTNQSMPVSRHRDNDDELNVLT